MHSGIDKQNDITEKRIKYRETTKTQKKKLLEVFQELAVQWIQRTYEHIPYVQAIDAVRWEGLISKTPIPGWSLWYYTRIFSAVPQSWIIFQTIKNWREIIQEANTNLLYILHWEGLPEDISTNMEILMASIVWWLIIYYIWTKWSDVRQVYKKFNNKWESSTTQNNDNICIT